MYGVCCRSPVKKKSLISEERVLTPRQRLDLRKRQRAEAEAERIKKAVAQNFNEGRMRFKEHRKKQVGCVVSISLLPRTCPT